MRRRCLGGCSSCDRARCSLKQRPRSARLNWGCGDHVAPGLDQLRRQEERPGDRPGRRHPRRPAARHRGARLRGQHPRPAGACLCRSWSRRWRSCCRVLQAGRVCCGSRLARPRQGDRRLPAGRPRLLQGRGPAECEDVGRPLHHPHALVRVLAHALHRRLRRTSCSRRRASSTWQSSCVRRDRERVPGDRRARQPRGGELLHRGSPCPDVATGGRHTIRRCRSRSEREDPRGRTTRPRTSWFAGISGSRTPRKA